MHKLKAAFFIFLVVVNWGSMIIVTSPFLLITWLYDLITTPRHSWFLSSMLGQDLIQNVILGGHHRTYISSILGYLQSNNSRGGTYMALFVNWFWVLLFKEENHCIKAMRKDDVYDFSARRAILGTATYFLSIYLIYTGIGAV